jgi:Glycosyl hydrolase family 67 N-terminus
VLACALCTAAIGQAETGHDAWLRYARLQPAAAERYRALPTTILSLSDTLVLNTAQGELVHGAKGMLGKTLRIALGVPTESAIVTEWSGNFEILLRLAHNRRLAWGCILVDRQKGRRFPLHHHHWSHRPRRALRSLRFSQPDRKAERYLSAERIPATVSFDPAGPINQSIGQPRWHD